MRFTATVCGKVFRDGIECGQSTHHTGYKVVRIGEHQWRVHRFVWVFFNGEPAPGMVINHKDGNKHNNHLSNLECVSPRENTQHAYRIGLMKGKQGEEHPVAKLSNAEVMEMFSLFPTHTNTQLAEKYNLHSRYISLIRHKRRWKHLWQQYEGSETMAQASREQGLSKHPLPNDGK